MLSRFVLSNSIKIKLFLFWSKLLTCLCLSELRCCLAKIAVSKLSILYYVSMYVTYYSIVIQRRTYEFDGSTRLDQGRVFVIKNWPDQWTHRIFFYISKYFNRQRKALISRRSYSNPPVNEFFSAQYLFHSWNVSNLCIYYWQLPHSNFLL